MLCESSNVLFEATSAQLAYDKTVDWGQQHESDSAFSFLGIRHLNSLDESLGDGVEIGGGFYEEPAAWMRRDELVPARDELPVIVLEKNPDTPIKELIDSETDAMLRKLFAIETGSDEKPR